jgi:hypothetical protein
MMPEHICGVVYILGIVFLGGYFFRKDIDIMAAVLWPLLPIAWIGYKVAEITERNR